MTKAAGETGSQAAPLNTLSIEQPLNLEYTRARAAAFAEHALSSRVVLQHAYSRLQSRAQQTDPGQVGGDTILGALTAVSEMLNRKANCGQEGPQ